MKRKIKYEKPNCPICHENNNIISNGNSSAHGMVGIAHKGVSGSGGSHSYFYCTKCYVDFNIQITYKKYAKAKQMGGNTGYMG